MGFKKPKAYKKKGDPLGDGDKRERDLDPTKVLHGGGRVAKKKNISDAPKSFQHIMQFVEMKTRRDEDKRKEKERQKKLAAKKAAAKDEPQTVTETLRIMPGESIPEFNQRVRQKMHNNLRLVGTEQAADAGKSTNPSNEGEGPAQVTKRTERKRVYNAQRKQRKQARKHSGDSDDERPATATAAAPKFGEQAQAPPVFTALPKARFKRAVPLPNSREEADQRTVRDEQAIKKMISRTARLSPLERMQAKRKLRAQGDSAAEKRIIAAERDQAVRRYRMLRAARESAKGAAAS
ncbi:hypothetical protein IWQ56_000401 [Coemansia nantahalensis]|uniref:Uncharacterized protein n=1 Tax=Coemansia nantahalensis TaxID=2789366 RepID=A0ACC1JY92_9FUNG|nr:hypothetical protein IWQ57_003068 [Coemansia nantahalensis]KAJ2774838.1 hypothetical protein IWQ56_000401 [Coemansia nantahalensis]